MPLAARLVTWPNAYTVELANAAGTCWHCNNTRKTDGDEQCIGCARCRTCIAYGQSVGCAQVDNGNDGHAPECTSKGSLLP